MILEKRENGIWSFIDFAHPKGQEFFPFGCIIDRGANTFVITKENRPSYPKEPLPVEQVQIRVLPSTSLETYTTGELLENRLLALGFPPLVVGVTPSEIPAGVVINKGLLNPTTTTITAVTNETHLYFISENGDVNGTLPVKVGDVVGINSDMLWIESNNNQTLQNVLDSMDSGTKIPLELSSGRYISLTDGTNIFNFSPQLLQLIMGGGQFSVGETGFHFTDFNQTIYFDQGRIRFHNNSTGLGHNLYGQDATQDNEIYLPNDSGILSFSHTLYERTTPTTTITGVVSETPMQAIDISTLGLKVGSYFEIHDYIERLTRAGTASLKYYSHNSSNFSTGTPTLIAQFNITANAGNIPFSRRFTVQSGNLLKGYAYDGSILNDISGTSAVYRTTPFAGKTHIISTITPSASSDTAISVATIIKGKK